MLLPLVRACLADVVANVVADVMPFLYNLVADVVPTIDMIVAEGMLCQWQMLLPLEGLIFAGFVANG